MPWSSARGQGCLPPHPGFRTPCAKTGVCMDCNSQDRICNTRMEMLRCWPDKRVLVVLIDQDLGL